MKEERQSNTKKKVAMKMVEEAEGRRKINLMMETEIRKTGRKTRCRRRERKGITVIARKERRGGREKGGEIQKRKE